MYFYLQIIVTLRYIHHANVATDNMYVREPEQAVHEQINSHHSHIKLKMLSLENQCRE